MTVEGQFSLEQAMAAQAALRKQLHLPPEEFPLSALIGMLSDEIEQLRTAGETDDNIAKAIGDAVGSIIQPTDISAHYASPEQRHR